MFQPNPVDIAAVRRNYRLSEEGLLQDKVTRLTVNPFRSGNMTFVIVEGKRVSYRRAVWACVHDTLPNNIYKIVRDGDERIGNLSLDKGLKQRRYQAKASRDGKQVSLGTYATKEEVRAAVAYYNEHGEFMSVKGHNGVFRVLRHVGAKSTVIGVYPTLNDAQAVIRGRERYGKKVIAFAVSSLTRNRQYVGTFVDAYQAKQGVEKWIIETGFVMGYDLFEPI